MSACAPNFVLFQVYTSNFSDTELASSFLFCGVETYDERFSIDLGAMFHAAVVDRYEDTYRLRLLRASK